MGRLHLRAVTALAHPASGLLTENSFAKTPNGEPMRFERVDAILLISHQQYLKWALAEDGRDRPYAMGDQAFKWDIDPARPVAFLATPDGRELPPAARTALHALDLADIRGAEYQASDLINWINTSNDPPPRRGSWEDPQ